ncbi:MAG: hypothetical protein M1480_19755 [Bacteroidetes bacterium]|nr:hypothetical protein [Bacteroidota bacterium]
MIKKNNDSKFVIYQVLYIFVVTVLALKGADLDLDKVISTNNAVNKSVKDSLVTLIDSLTTSGLKFEIKVNPNIEAENVTLKEKVASLNERMATLTEKIKEIPPVQNNIPKEVTKQEEQTVLQSPISVTQTFLQFTWNIVKNNGDVSTSIYDPKKLNSPLVVVPPGQEKKFNLMDQTQVIAKYGSQEEKINVLPMKQPEIKIERVTTKMSSPNIYAQDLQNITVFNVAIIYQRPDQLKITHTGPISVTGPYKDADGNSVYYVSLRIASNKNKFDDWLDRYGNLREADGRYKVNFFFTADDKISKAHVTAGDSFYFTDFSK